MTLHLLKLCVGCDTVEELQDWQRQRLRKLRQADPAANLMHVTRQTPRRAGFERGASSIYWVIAGFIRARQLVKDLQEVRGADGIARCGLILEPKLAITEAYPRRPFQGWRYIPAEEAPKDLDPSRNLETSIPAAMRNDLLELRLL